MTRTEADDDPIALDVYRCQFCGEESPEPEWTRRKDHCPKCGRAYDPMLAQEGDD